MDAGTQQLSILIILAALASSVVITQFVRIRRGLLATLRTIRAYEVLPSFVGLSIESNRPLHMAFGSSGLGGESTILTLASAELFYQVATRSAIGDISPVITLSDAITLPLGQDILRRAYRSRNRLSQYRYTNVRWYPSGSRSLTYAAALTAVMSYDRVSANIFAGKFGSELALIAESALRHNQSLIAMSDELEGQAVAYAFSEFPLIGEEIFAAGSYLGGGSAQLGATITIDLFRWFLMLALVLMLAAQLGTTLSADVFRALLIGIAAAFVATIVLVFRNRG